MYSLYRHKQQQQALVKAQRPSTSSRQLRSSNSTTRIQHWVHGQLDENPRLRTILEEGAIGVAKAHCFRDPGEKPNIYLRK